MRAAIEPLPKLPSVCGNETGREEAAALKTGTDDLPISSDEKSYRIFTGKPSFDSYKMSSNVSNKDTKVRENTRPDATHSSLSDSNIDINCSGLTTENRRGRDSIYPLFVIFLANSVYSLIPIKAKI